MTDALMSAILAMDAYNRSYDEGLVLTGATVDQGKIGFAEIVQADDVAAARAVSFFAIAYDIDGERVISYRGTDNALGTTASLWTDGDIFNGWIGGAGVISDQAIRAVNFYQAMSNDLSLGQDYRLANISLTGHSLGGGLAGLVASLYHREAMVFDNMPFEAATDNLFDLAEDYGTVADAVYGTGNTPWLPDDSLIDGYSVNGEILAYFRLLSSFQPIELSPHAVITDSVALHSQSLLVSLLYGETLTNANWENGAEYFITKMSDATIAESLGWGSSGEGGIAASGDKMAVALAYSALDISSNPTNGVLAYGDTAIRSLFDDANDLGAAIVRVSGDPTGVSVALDEVTKDFIGSIITNYAGALAYEKIARYGNNSQPDRTTGVLAFDDTGGSLSLNLDDDYWEFGSGEHDIVAKQDFLDHLFDTAGVSIDIGASLSWYSSSNSISSNLINSVTFDLNGQFDEIGTPFLSPVGLNFVHGGDKPGQWSAGVLLSAAV